MRVATEHCGAFDRMKRLVFIWVAVILVGCSHKYSYTGTVADVESTILAEPSGMVHLQVEARDTNWLRYRMVRDMSGLWITNGAATVRVEGGYVVLKGSDDVRDHIARALKVK
jgi:hypothetical protein